jgi:hypothetical protein
MRRQYDHIDLRVRSLAEAHHNHFAARGGDLVFLVYLVIWFGLFFCSRNEIDKTDPSTR